MKKLVFLITSCLMFISCESDAIDNIEMLGAPCGETVIISGEVHSTNPDCDQTQHGENEHICTLECPDFMDGDVELPPPPPPQR